MQPEGLNLLFCVVVTLALLASLWGILRLQRRRRKKELDALDATGSAGPKSAVPEALDAKSARRADAALSPVLQPLPDQVPRAAPAQRPAKAAPDLLLSAGLASTRASLWGRMVDILGGAPKIDGAVIEALEEVLLTSDVGVAMTMRLIDALQAEAKNKALDAQAVRALLKGQLLDVFRAVAPPSGAAPTDLVTEASEHKPKVVLFVGVNGVGKTTTIGKVAHALTEVGKQVVLAAGDTFRAAAVQQLQIWGERTGARVVCGAERADPASVMFNAMQAAQAQQADVLLADTAGRLHTNVELMEEIKKVRRALSRLRADAPDEVWLVVDATTGQNALHQAKQFHEAVTLTGIVLTKLDGTAKGGIVVAIAEALKVPVRYIGVGEQAHALRPFDAEAFVEALL